MQTLTVKLPDHREYPIHVGSGLLSQGDSYARYIAGKHVLIVTNEVVAPLYLDTVRDQLVNRGFDVRDVILPDGEQYKTLEIVERIWCALLEANYNRGATIIALGGGVVGDMTGFAAACYQRGVAFIQMPTTLLSQVDSSVGGKTGVNHALGKNMIGAFWQPRAVIIDIDTLSTLPSRELSSGLAEVIKYGFVRDSRFLEWLEQTMSALRRLDPAALQHAILTSCAIKAEIVSEDETEQGVRALLNLGHTFGHAIETHQGYGRWLHGEGVAAGTAMAARFSHALGYLTLAEAARVEALVQLAGLPIHAPENMSAEEFIVLMRRDKKTLDSGMRLVLMRTLGEGCIESGIDETRLSAFLDAYPRGRLTAEA